MASTVLSKVWADVFSGASLGGLDFPESGTPGISALAREVRGDDGVPGTVSEEVPPTSGGPVSDTSGVAA
jgi:hypothetical protein